MSTVIVDCGLGNLHSVVRGCRKCGQDPVVTSDAQLVESAERLILPGVGAFGKAMQSIDAGGLRKPILNYIASGRPFLGICLGLQLLFEQSEEFGTPKGLGVLQGTVKRFTCENPVPHVGWNRIRFVETDHLSLYSGIDSGEWVYFVHSFYVEDIGLKYTTTVAEYGGLEFTASICSGNVHATQFHPEKSGEVGLKFISNFLSI
ncbi:MAG: imidazole glycerol phosphate synthase subunit HisH [Verrucomicrobiales bacterium]|nr:imidazole glycerol phosphate synthase subunit HisH [Verrucomicrobiales bacterium]